MLLLLLLLLLLLQLLLPMPRMPLLAMPMPLMTPVPVCGSVGSGMRCLLNTPKMLMVNWKMTKHFADSCIWKRKKISLRDAS